MAINIRPSSRTVIEVKPVLTIKREPMTYAKKQGWQQKGRVWNGYYRTRYGSFRGSIEQDPSGREFRFYIFEPPVQVLAGVHGACFRKDVATGNRYWIHFSYKPADMDSGILEVEQIIRASFEDQWRSHASN
jgi:hypothetical protein